MALNKAQLMDTPGGPGVTGAVKSGTGILISGDGTISVNPATNVTQLIAGTNITLNPANGFGAVTITAGGGGGGTITGVTAGTGMSGGGTSGTVTLNNAGVTGLTAGANITLSGSTGNVTITAAGGGGGGTITGVTAGSGLSGGGTSGTVTLSNSGVTRLNAGSNVTLTGNTGDITISASGGGGSGTITGVTAGTGLSGGGTSGTVTLNNTGVTGLVAGSNITLSGGTGNITISASGGSSLSPADFNTAVAGTSTTVYSNPNVAVAKTSGNTGAAVIPGGLASNRPGSPTSGMLRFNNDPQAQLGERLELYLNSTGTWKKLAYAAVLPVANDVTIPPASIQSGTIVCRNLGASGGFFIDGSLTIIASGNVDLQGGIQGTGRGVPGAAGFVTRVPFFAVYVGPGFNIGGGSTTVGGIAYSASVSEIGSGGAGGFIAPASGDGPGGTGTGGNSGASLLIRAGGQINSFANIFLDGAPGDIGDRQSNIYVSGPGGGSGGICVFHADGNSANNNIIQCRGGGGAGPHNGGGGGGGGGGGIIIVQSDTGTATLGNCVVTGGAGAPGGGGITLGGGGGGGCGGKGGDGGSAQDAPGLAGASGFTSTFGSPL